MQQPEQGRRRERRIRNWDLLSSAIRVRGYSQRRMLNVGNDDG